MTAKKEEARPKNEEYERMIFEAGLSRKCSGRERSLSLEQEFFLTMVRLHLGLLLKDLAFRFQISSAQVTRIFYTWIKLMALEFKGLIVWAERDSIQRNLPDTFKKFYPKCRVIIDCTEIFLETPSSLEFAAICWSNYKHRYTIKILVGITPNGTISFLSLAYGGRASDIHITKDSGFYRKLLPGDQIMADRGFKIKDTLAYYQCTLAIPPSTKSNMQLSKNAVSKTSLIANVRIFVEKAIRRIKEYRILKTDVPIIVLPQIDDILTVCAAFTNLKDPLLKQ